MKAIIEKVNVYNSEDIMLIASSKIMHNFACYMSNMIREAERKAYEDGRINTARHYGKIAQQFSNICQNIKEEE